MRTALGEEISICVENPKENMWKSIEKAIIESLSELNIRLQNFDEGIFFFFFFFFWKANYV